MGEETSEINIRKRLVVTKRFKERMNEIQEVGFQLFGESVAIAFREKIFERILLVKEFPEMYPICPFIESTIEKQYRNIIFDSKSIMWFIQ